MPQSKWGVSEVFNPRKTHPDFTYPWVRMTPHQPIIPMPDTVVVCFKRCKSIEFDFLPYGHFFLFSERLLAFLVEHGLEIAHGKSRALLLNTKGESLTDDVFYFVRHVNWLTKQEIEWLRNEEGEICSARAATTSQGQVFFPTLDDCIEAKELQPYKCFLVSVELREVIEQRFKNPTLYTVNEWRIANEYDLFASN